MSRTLHAGRLLTAIVSVVVLTTAGAWVQGRLSNRWGQGVNLPAAIARLGSLPTEFGDWELEGTHDLEPSTVSLLHCAAYLNGTYVNTRTGSKVDVVVLMGPPGPMTAHTPEVCYSARDYALDDRPTRVELGSEADLPVSLERLELRANDLQGQSLEVLYGWSTGEAWSAPDEPRIAFGLAPLVYKIQVSRSMQPGEQSGEASQFARQFLPVVAPALLPPDKH